MSLEYNVEYHNAACYCGPVLTQSRILPLSIAGFHGFPWWCHTIGSRIHRLLAFISGAHLFSAEFSLCWCLVKLIGWHMGMGSDSQCPWGATGAFWLVDFHDYGNTDCWNAPLSNQNPCSIAGVPDFWYATLWLRRNRESSDHPYFALQFFHSVPFVFHLQ